MSKKGLIWLLFSIAPTRVGMNRPIWMLRVQELNCPHTRGDEPPDLSAEQVQIELPPHVWE